MRRPGPDRIGEGESPGGLVFYFYAIVPEERLLRVSKVQPGEEESAAIADADEMTRLGLEAVCLVIFDGDSGERLRYPDLIDRGDL